MSVARGPKDRGKGLVAATVAVAAVISAGAASAGTPPRPAAAPFLGMPPTSSLLTPGDWEVVEVFPNLTFTNPVFLIPEPASNRLWLTEQQGRILSFVNDPDVNEMKVVLDLRDVTKGDGDSGLLSMAFHPRYADADSASEGMIFAAYGHQEEEEGSPLEFRVSRFHVDRTTGLADPASELVLIEQLDQQSWHQGGALLFRPSDGFLYISLGDEGGGRCQYGNCQRIDRDLFAGVLRIDVDNIGGEVSHPPPRQPQTGSTANYSVPASNPFVGREGVLEEFYALGLRSPHRMTLDPVDDLIWIGDVGQSQREEVDVLAPGANYQWNVMEGTVPFDEESELPDPLIGTWTPPVYDYGRSSDGVVIGGYVYRGAALPELRGRYIFGDYLSGRIWAMSYQKTAGGVEFVSREELLRTSIDGGSGRITSFGLDADGEIYVLTLGDAARIHKLVPAGKDPGDMPATLSATGLFEDLASLVPVPSLVPYEVRVPLWSDGAAKRRWMSVPSTGVIDYSADGAWVFPPGTVFVKHFEMQLDENEPGSLRRLETRVLVVQEDHRVYGVTYKWRDDGSDADLLTATRFEDIEVEDKDGLVELRHYQYPGPVDCLTCHDDGAGFVLGPRARQFDAVANELVSDQLSWFADAGFLDVDSAALDRGRIPAFAALDEEAASLELRVRSYLDVNCSHCHGSQDLDRALWNARVTKPLNRQGIVMGPLVGDYGSEDDRVVRPGDLDSSILLRRVDSIDSILRMPPLARSVRDEAFVSVLEDWILSLEGTTLPPLVCGDVIAPYDTVGAGDALAVLRAAVGLQTCDGCGCDVNADDRVNVTDALRVLRHAVGLVQPLDCPPCG